MKILKAVEKLLGAAQGGVSGTFDRAGAALNPLDGGLGWSNPHQSGPPSRPAGNNYQEQGLPSLPGLSQLQVTPQYANRFLQPNQQLQPFGSVFEDEYTGSQAMQPVDPGVPQGGINGMFLQNAPRNPQYPQRNLRIR